MLFSPLLLRLEVLDSKLMCHTVLPFTPITNSLGVTIVALYYTGSIVKDSSARVSTYLCIFENCNSVFLVRLNSIQIFS